MSPNDNTINVRLSGDAQELQKALSQGTGHIEAFSGKAGAGLRSVGAEASKLEGGMANLAQGMRTAFIGSSIAVGLIALKNMIYDVGAELVQTQIKADKMRNGLNFAVGAENAAGEMAFIRRTAQQLGLELVSTSLQYTQLAAASRGTTLAGQQTRDIFTSISQASTVMGLSVEQSESALRAVSQMISKGKVQAEELRGQLGERLPGAFQIAARAMGVTTAELDKMLVSGNLLATDFLPKFAAQLSLETGPALDEASKSMQAAVNRMSNAWTDFKRNVNESGVAKALQNEIQGVGTYVQSVSDAMERARKSGLGSVGQLSAGLGQIIARAPFDLLAVSANTLNGSLNFLSGGALQLNTSIDLLPDALKTTAQQTDILAASLPKAEREMALLKARLAEQPDSIYLKSEIYQLSLFIEKARGAKAAVADLQGLQGNQGEDARIQRQAAASLKLTEDRKESEKDMLAIRMKQAGVDKSYIDTLSQLQAAKELGTITDKEYIARTTQLAIETTKKSAAGVAAAEASRQGAKDTRAETKELERQSDILAQLSGYTKDHKEQLALLERMRAKNLISQSQFLELQQAEIDRQPIIKKGLQETAKAYEEAYKYRSKHTEQLLKDMADQVTAGADVQQMAIDYGRTVQAANDRAEFELTLAGKSAAARDIAIAQYEIEIKLQERILSIKKKLADQADQDAAIARVTETAAAEKAAVTLTVTRKQAQDDWTKFYDSIYNGLSDSLYRGFEAGKGFFKSFWDSIKNLFKTTVLKLAVQGVMTGVFGGSAGLANAASSLLGGGSGGGVGGGGGFLGQAGSLLGSIGSGMGIASAITGGLSAGFGGLAGSLGGLFGAAGTGATLGGALSAGSIALGAGNIAGALSTFAGALGPIGIGIGLLSKAFGRGPKRVTDTGISGTFTEDGASVQAYETWRQSGGWFKRSRSGTNYSAISGELDKSLDDSLKGISLATRGYASAIGLSADALNGFTQSIKISLAGLSEEAKQEAISKALTGFADGLAGVFTEINEFANDGETASATLERLATSLVGANSVMGVLQHRLFDIGLAGADAASNLVGLMGGLEQFNQTTQGYFQNFYSPAEQRAAAVKAITGTLNAAGGNFSEDQIGSIDRNAFRALVESVDATNAASQPLYAALLGVSGAFAQITEAANEAAQSLGTEGFSNVIDFQRAKALANNPQSGNSVIYTASGVKIGRNEVSAQGGSDMAALIAEIANLRIELKAAQIAQISAAKATENVFVKWENDGLPAVRVVNA